MPSWKIRVDFSVELGLRGNLFLEQKRDFLGEIAWEEEGKLQKFFANQKSWVCNCNCASAKRSKRKYISITHTDSTVTSSSETTKGWEKAVMPSREAEERPSSLQYTKNKNRPCSNTRGYNRKGGWCNERNFRVKRRGDIAQPDKSLLG